MPTRQLSVVRAIARRTGRTISGLLAEGASLVAQRLGWTDDGSSVPAKPISAAARDIGRMAPGAPGPNVEPLG